MTSGNGGQTYKYYYANGFFPPEIVTETSRRYAGSLQTVFPPTEILRGSRPTNQISNIKKQHFARFASEGSPHKGVGSHSGATHLRPNSKARTVVSVCETCILFLAEYTRKAA